jgi:quercetin dioxygenase-like cupin family protein
MVEPLQPLVKASDMQTFEEIPGASSRFVRLDERGLPVIIGLSTYAPGVGPNEHRHPERQVFVVYEGRGVYTVDGVDVIAEAGDVVVVPPNALHRFRGDGDAPLRHVTVFETPAEMKPRW